MRRIKADIRTREEEELEKSVAKDLQEQDLDMEEIFEQGKRELENTEDETTE